MTPNKQWKLWVLQSGLHQEPGYWLQITPAPVTPERIMALLREFRGRCRMVVRVPKLESIFRCDRSLFEGRG